MTKGHKIKKEKMPTRKPNKNKSEETRNIKIIVQKTTLMRMLFPFTTKTENFATLGCDAPNSLLTRTLQSWKLPLACF